jgi:cell division protein FtsQ
MTWLLAIVVLLGGAALAIRWALISPRFAVTAVQVSGNERVTREVIEAAAAIATGSNLFTLDRAAMIARLESLPLIRRADVIREFPNQVTLVVEERRAFTLVHAGALHWIDEEGVDLGLETRAVSLEAPLLSGLGPEDLGSAHHAASSRTIAGVAVQRLLARSQAALLQQIAEIDLSRPEGPVLYTEDGVEVRLGQHEWETRLARLGGVLAQLSASGQRVTSVDLRFRDQVVLRPR